MGRTIRRPKWDSENHQRAAREWKGTPSFEVAQEADQKVDDHPLEGVSVYEETIENASTSN